VARAMVVWIERTTMKMRMLKQEVCTTMRLMTVVTASPRGHQPLELSSTDQPEPLTVALPS
jgi:hypothetical protein